MPKVDKEYSETISLRLTKGQRDKLRAVAEASGLSQSDYLRQLITIGASLQEAWGNLKY